MNILSLFCHHNYEVINQFETKSELEQVISLGLKPNTFHGTEKKTVTDFKCVDCGKIKRKVIKHF